MRVIPVCMVLGGWLSMPALAVEAEDWMQRLAKAEKQQSYAGTFVYERNGSFSSHGVWQQVEGDTVRERLLQLDGAPVEVLLVNGEVRCASRQLAHVNESPRLRKQAFDVESLAQWYEFRLIGDSRVAGRSTVAISVRPKDQHRYGFELHLDSQTALPLKSLLLGESGQLLERFQYTGFTLDGVSAADLEPSKGCEAVSVSQRPESLEPTWHSDWLPPGFQLLDSSVRQSPASEESVIWLTYGDGLARFSVFLEPLRNVVVEDARSQMGPTVAVSKRATTAAGDMMVTVVGEIPLGTAERVALSMREGPGLAGR